MARFPGLFTAIGQFVFATQEGGGGGGGGENSQGILA